MQLRIMLTGIALCFLAAGMTLQAACQAPRREGPAAHKVKLQLVTDRILSPVAMAVPGDGSGRLFICQKEGRVWLIQGGKLQEKPFLDVSAEMVRINAGYDERGLLGIAFHPQFKKNRKFYVYYSVPSDKKGSDHKSRIAEFTALANDPNMADPASRRVLMEIEQPESNHNGGALVFGRDGYLYIGLGDGGAWGDRHGAIGNGQDLGTLLGKILRIDVNVVPYGVPKDNPFVGQAGARPEIWAYGLRNPWRITFDRATGRLFAGDVGQNKYEEVDIIVKGGNYGWRIMEGYHDYNVPAGADKSRLIAPVDEYDHNLGISVTGGYVYRGKAIPALKGLYVYGDYNGKAFVLAPDGQKWQRSGLELDGKLSNSLQILSWGEDEAGELYMLTSASSSQGFTGAVYKLAP